MALSNPTLNEHLLASKSTPIISVVVFIFVAGLIGFYTTWPRVEMLLPGNALDRGAVDRQLQERRDYLTSLKGLVALQEDKNSPNNVALHYALPTDKDIPSLFVAYEVLARQRLVDLVSVDIVTPDVNAAEASKKGMKQLNASLKFEKVRYANLKELLNDFEQLQRISDIQSFGYDAKSGFMTMNVATYYLPNK